MSNSIGEYFSVIGMGAVGRTLLMALHEKGISIKSVYNKNPEKAKIWGGKVGALYNGSFPEKQEELGQFIFICVPDDVIEEIADKLAQSNFDISGKVFVHCSGAKPASVMSPLSSQKAQIASFHPLQTFTDEIDADRFKGISVSVQGDNEAVPLLMDLAKILGANPVKISEQEKLKLHIAAVMTCNYMVSLADAASQLLTQKEDENSDETGLNMLFPLMEQTLTNLKQYGPGKSLSGPVKRGDAQTVKTHLENLAKHPDIKKIYACLGDYTAGRLDQKKEISRDVYDRLHDLFLNI